MILVIVYKYFIWNSIYTSPSRISYNQKQILINVHPDIGHHNCMPYGGKSYLATNRPAIILKVIDNLIWTQWAINKLSKMIILLKSFVQIENLVTAVRREIRITEGIVQHSCYDLPLGQSWMRTI